MNVVWWVGGIGQIAELNLIFRFFYKKYFQKIIINYRLKSVAKSRHISIKMSVLKNNLRFFAIVMDIYNKWQWQADRRVSARRWQAEQNKNIK